MMERRELKTQRNVNAEPEADKTDGLTALRYKTEETAAYFDSQLRAPEAG